MTDAMKKLKASSNREAFMVAAEVHHDMMAMRGMVLFLEDEYIYLISAL